MSRITLFAAALLAAFSLIAAKDSPTRLDVTVQPEGTQVFIDGQLRGAAPLQLFDIGPGRHLVHLQSPGHRSLDEFVVLEDGGFVQKNWTLEREKALFLLRTTPADAEVRYNGVALGRTPFLSTTLNAGETYALELVCNGYKTKKISVTFDGRTPVVRDEELMLDSGVVKCVTDPPGATVLVNGVERGVTPLVADKVPKGLAMFTFRKEGYGEVSRELRLSAGEERSLEIKLSPKAAMLKVVSSPEGARVFLDGDYQGKTPVEVASVKPGEHELKLELAGHRTVVKPINLGNGDEMTESIDMENVLGRLQITTVPGGAKIILDGKTVGTTKVREGADRSDVLILNGIPAGEHSMVVHLDGYTDVRKRIKLDPTSTLDIPTIQLKRIFLPDTEVETIHGTYRGMFSSRTADSIVIEIKPGIHQPIRQADIRKIKSLK